MDKEFRVRYEKALENASKDDLEQIAGLGRIQLEEWVNAPEKIRPFLLKKWRESPDPNKALGDALSQLGLDLNKRAQEIGAKVDKSFFGLGRFIK